MERRERAAGSEDGAALRPFDGLVRGAFALGGGVRVREDHRAVVDARHRLDDLAVEAVRDGADADEDARLHRLDDLRKVLDGGVCVRERKLEFAEAGGVRGDQAAAVDEPAACVGICVGHAFADHLLADEVGDADGRAAGAEEEVGVVGEPLVEDAVGAEEARHRDGCGALDVIVEAADLLAVAREKRHGGAVGEVLELDAAAREDLLHRLHELVEERVVLRALDALHAQARVERVLEERLVVGAEVEHHRERVLGRYPRARRVERELPDGDAHAADAEVAEAEDALAVGDDDEAHVLLGPVAQHFLDAALALEAHVQALRAAHDVPELLARLAHGGGVDERHVLGRVARQQLVVEALVAVLQFREEHVFVERRGLLRKLDALALELRLLVLHAIGQQADQAEALAFMFAERGSLVEARVVEEVEAGVVAVHGTGRIGLFLPHNAGSCIPQAVASRAAHSRRNARSSGVNVAASWMSLPPPALL